MSNVGEDRNDATSHLHGRTPHVVEPGVVLLAALGVRVVEVPHLGEPSLLLPDRNLALIDGSLTTEDRHAELDWLLDQVLAHA